MIENNKYHIMLNEVNDLLNSDYTDKELLKLKDDIRGLALYGDLSDYEASHLLELLPNISNGIVIEEDEPADSEEDESEPVSKLGVLAETPVERYYNKDREIIEAPKKQGGFDSFSEEVPRFYNNNPDPDEVALTSRQTPQNGFDSFGSQEISRFFNNSDDDDIDETPAQPAQNSGFGSFDSSPASYGRRGLSTDDDDDDDDIYNGKKDSGKAFGFDSLF